MQQAGKLDQRVTLQGVNVTRGPSGGMVKGWQDMATMWAAVRNLSGNERAASTAGGQAAEARTEITIRYRPFISTQVRVLHRGAVYNVRHVNNLMARNEVLILTCDTGVNDG